MDQFQQCEDPNAIAIDINSFAKLVQPVTGVLRCNWRSSNGNISTLTYGSATLLSPRVVLTCCHNIYAESKGAKCDEAIFIPAASGRLSESRAYLNELYGFKNEPPTRSFKISPVSEELALVVLSEPFEGDDVVYPSLGSISREARDTPVCMVSYPSQHYQTTLNLRDAFAYPKRLVGNIHSIEDTIINHTMATSVGCSGSAIFAQPSLNQSFICGIHTHRGLKSDYNSGLYFTQEILNRLEQYFSEINRQHGWQEKLKLFQDCEFAKDTQTCSESEDYDDDNRSQISCFDDYFLQEKDNPELCSAEKQYPLTAALL